MSEYPQWSVRDYSSTARYLLRWLIRLLPVSILIGSACSLFLWSISWATRTRQEIPELLYLLPIAGIIISWLYQKFGERVEAGNNLIVEEIHSPTAGVPIRMTPLIFLSTILTHLFGGSAGREGTAVQMGGSIASSFTSIFKLQPQESRVLLMAGMAAGFGAVFGTPIAGAIFAVEVLAIGKIEYAAILPCLLAAVMGDTVCRAWGIHHTEYHQLLASTPSQWPLSFEGTIVLKVLIAAIAFGLASTLFSESTHGLGRLFKRYIPMRWLRPVIGAIAIIALTTVLGTDYLGLGVDGATAHSVSIVSAFQFQGAEPLSWLWKIVFTVITLSSGFKGGEVTPLFFIGATLGNALSVLLGAPTDLFAALGFVAVFAGATNTPLACTIMSVELFGAAYLPYFALASYIAYLISGHSGIYRSQQVHIPKGKEHHAEHPVSLAALRSSTAPEDATVE